ncbi:MAG TPA: isovaleryl-CoA dehydrogenase [Steroidobacteraceae bacterium]|nr:isovaleryl-CoA dehydrogenase [Steroidobacteraceae bacterium]
MKAIYESANHPDELVDYNLFTSNAALADALEREGASWAVGRLRQLGARLGTRAMFALGDAANRNPPVLKLFDRFGSRRDEVEFHPAWHELMRVLVAEGLHTSPWADPKPGAHVERAAAYLLWGEIENGTQCPATMTYGVVPTLARQPADFGEWMPRLLSRDYDERLLPIAQKRGALIGMGMTEKQGGSDVRSNTTRAVAVGTSGPGKEYRLTGHKWFFSAPMCDAFLVLAQTAGGLSSFFVPRVLPDGTRNNVYLQRLKDKLGNRSNASSEVEFDDTFGRLVGEEGRGIPTILEMGVFTRFDCATGAAGIMHQCVAQAIHHARHRSAFGRLLIDQPLMRNVLADLALECEAAIALALRLARAFDAQQDEAEVALRRVLVPVAKYWICKRAPAVGVETMEVLGGNGYIEEGPIARRFRELPLNSIWEGSGNIMCLDVLRALSREPRTLDALAMFLQRSGGRDARYDQYVARLLDDLRGVGDEANARVLTGRIALAAQATILLAGGASSVAESFISSRIATGAPAVFGALPAGLDHGALIERAFKL